MFASQCLVTSTTLHFYKGERFDKKSILDIKPMLSPPIPNSMYMPRLPIPLEQAGVSSKENYLDLQQTLMKLRSKQIEACRKYENKKRIQTRDLRLEH